MEYKITYTSGRIITEFAESMEDARYIAEQIELPTEEIEKIEQL